MSTVPVGLRGLFPEEGLWGEAEIIAEGPAFEAERVVEDPMSGPCLLRCGGAELGLVLSQADPPNGWSHAVTAPLEGSR